MTGTQATELLQSSSPVCCEKISQKVNELLVKFNPDAQMRICSDTKLCIAGQFPTLAEIKRDYGSNIPKAWLVPQLHNLSWYCGVKDKLDDRQLEECAYVIASNFFFLKVSELMLFFHRFKSGRYGKFYGRVDPLVIVNALREFVAERNNALELYERDEHNKQLEEHKKTAVSWKEYCIMTGQSERISKPIIPQTWQEKEHG